MHNPTKPNVIQVTNNPIETHLEAISKEFKATQVTQNPSYAHSEAISNQIKDHTAN
jgi:hypothetical protein